MKTLQQLKANIYTQLPDLMELGFCKILKKINFVLK